MTEVLLSTFFSTDPFFYKTLLTYGTVDDIILSENKITWQYKRVGALLHLHRWYKHLHNGKTSAPRRISIPFFQQKCKQNGLIKRTRIFLQSKLFDSV